MSSILDLEVFVRSADTGSLTAAARGLGLTPAAASIALKRLETRLGIRLLARSTRSMRLTEDLAHHSTLRYMRRGQANSTWYFRQGALLQEVEVSGDYLSDDGEIVRRWALAGHGIAYKANLDVARDIQAGRLVPLLPDWQGEPAPFNLMCPHRLQVSERVKVLHRFLQARCVTLLRT